MSALLNSALYAGGAVNFRNDNIGPDHWSCGIPYDANGSVAVQIGAVPSYFHMGLPFSSVGRICVGTVDPDFFNSGALPMRILPKQVAIGDIGSTADSYVHRSRYTQAGRLNYDIVA